MNRSDAEGERQTTHVTPRNSFDDEIDQDNWKLYAGFVAMIGALLLLLCFILFGGSNKPRQVNQESADPFTQTVTPASAMIGAVPPTIPSGPEPVQDSQADVGPTDMDDADYNTMQYKEEKKSGMCNKVFGKCANLSDGNKKCACVTGSIVAAGAVGYGAIAAGACAGVTPCIEAATCCQATPVSGEGGAVVQYTCGEADPKMLCKTSTCCAAGESNACCCPSVTDQATGQVAEAAQCCTNTNGDCSIFACGAKSDCCGAVCCTPGSCGEEYTCCEVTSMALGGAACVGCVCATTGGR